MSKYSEKLKSPKWQKKRLEILNRDEWKCQVCGETEETLHVHHIYYLPNKDPWEYPEKLLITLCEFCHKDEHYVAYDDAILVLKQLRENGILYTDIRDMLGEAILYSDTRKEFSDFYGSLTQCRMDEYAKKKAYGDDK